jgi:hypothetical protein
MCPTCQAPERVLWTYGNFPELETVHVGNWITLKSCPDCGAYWCAVPHEPYGAFTFLTAWPYDVDTFVRLNEKDGGIVLHEWHNAVIREKWMALSPQEIEWIEHWRIRTYRHYNPIDCGPEMKATQYVQHSEEIDRYARDI